MPCTEEDVLRDLMHRATHDLNASPAVTTGVVTRQRRRHWRNRAVSAGVTGAAAGAVIGVVAYGTPGARPAGGPQAAQTSGGAPAIQLTAAQQALYQLSSAAAATPRPAGRYVEMREGSNGEGYLRTSVFDGQTGDVWTYQQGKGVPSELPVARHDSPTEAQFDAWPTDPTALRALLLRQAQQEAVQAQQAEQAQIAKLPAKEQAQKRQAAGAAPAQSPADEVFEQATDTLWNPLVGPALRSALYKVLASTPDVTVNTRTKDMTGRPAVEISRFNAVAGVDEATFEDPADGSVLESLWHYPANAATHATGAAFDDLYLSITSSGTRPGNPYTG